ncbi:metallophosphoesterase, partial [bacterium]|nr:metallophosphoesterase [bacterium]
MKTKLKIYVSLFSVALILLCATLGAYAFSFRNMTLDFIHISDTHISERPDTSYKALGSSTLLLHDAIKQINDIKGIDFVLFTGDLVDSATKRNYELYYSLLNELKYPSLNAFGNHDFIGMSKDEVLEIVRSNNPNYMFSDSYYAISPKTDYRIIFLDSIIKDPSSANGEIPKEQLEFLDNELLENQDKIVVIALHHPPVQPFVAKEHSLLNADEFNNILLKYKNPIVVLSGHYHATKLRRIGNIVYVSTPSMVTYPMAFRHIKIVNYKDRVLYKFDFIPTTLEDIKEQNRQSVISYSTLAGIEADRNIEFTYMKKQFKTVKYKQKKIAQAAKPHKTSKRELKKLTQQKTSKQQKKLDKQAKKANKKSNV